MAELLCVSTDVVDSLRDVHTKLKALAAEDAVFISIETTASLSNTRITPFFLTRLAELINNEKVHVVLVRGTADLMELLEFAGHRLSMLTIHPDTGEYLISFNPQMYIAKEHIPVNSNTLH